MPPVELHLHQIFIHEMGPDITAPHRERSFSARWATRPGFPRDAKACGPGRRALLPVRVKVGINLVGPAIYLRPQIQKCGTAITSAPPAAMVILPAEPPPRLLRRLDRASARVMLIVLQHQRDKRVGAL